MTRLREAFIDAVTAGIIRAFLWLVRAEELPPLRALPPPPARPKVCNCLECREQRLGQLFVLDAFLARALGTCAWVGHDVDRRFKQ